MGRMSLEGMLDGGLSLEQALVWHLTSNHFPPVPTTMVEPCIQAIDAIHEDDAERLIDLPEETSWRGQSKAPAWAIVEGHHLEAFLESDEDF